MPKRTMPICFDITEYELVEKYAKKHGMLNTSQVIEKILDEI